VTEDGHGGLAVVSLLTGGFGNLCTWTGGS